MKMYGERRIEIRSEDWATTRSSWEGKQSRKVAVRRKKDKKILHRRARRTYECDSYVIDERANGSACQIPVVPSKP